MNIPTKLKRFACLCLIVMLISCKGDSPSIEGSWELQAKLFTDHTGKKSEVRFAGYDPTHITFRNDSLISTRYPYYLADVKKYEIEGDTIYGVRDGHRSTKSLFRIENDELIIDEYFNPAGVFTYFFRRSKTDSNQISYLIRNHVDWRQFEKNWTLVDSAFYFDKSRCERCTLPQKLDLTGKNDNFSAKDWDLNYHTENDTQVFLFEQYTHDSLWLLLNCNHRTDKFGYRGIYIVND